MSPARGQVELPAGNERWIRLPTSGRCPFTGFSRSYYYQLIHGGRIKSANIREKGNRVGVRLIWLPSVLAYIEKHAEGGAA